MLLLFLIIDLYFLTPATIEQIFSPTAKLIIPTRIQIKEEKQKFRHIQ